MTGYRALPTADELRRHWSDSPRWRGVQRGYQAEDVVRLRGTIPVEHSIARLTSEKLWRYINEKPFVNALGALTGNQAMQQVKAGLDAKGSLIGWKDHFVSYADRDDPEKFASAAEMQPTELPARLDAIAQGTPAPVKIAVTTGPLYHIGKIILLGA